MPDLTEPDRRIIFEALTLLAGAGTNDPNRVRKLAAEFSPPRHTPNVDVHFHDLGVDLSFTSFDDKLGDGSLLYLGSDNPGGPYMYVSVNGVPMHFEAVEAGVDPDGFQTGADSEVYDALVGLTGPDGGAFRTCKIRGRDYIVYATPYRD